MNKNNGAGAKVFDSHKKVAKLNDLSEVSSDINLISARSITGAQIEKGFIVKTPEKPSKKVINETDLNPKIDFNLAPNVKNNNGSRRNSSIRKFTMPPENLNQPAFDGSPD